MQRIAGRLAAVTSLAVIGVLAGTSPASADTFPEPSHERVWALDGGGHAAIGSQDEQITRVQPLTTNGTTKEFFADLRAFGELSVPDGAPVSAVVTAGFQVGCMASYTGTSFGITVTPSAQIGGQIGGSGGFPNAGQVNGDVNGHIGISVAPSLTVNTGAGTITDVSLGQFQLKTTLGIVHAQQAHIKVDGCIGPVSARSYAKFEVQTEVGYDTDAVYGQVFPL